MARDGLAVILDLARRRARTALDAAAAAEARLAAARANAAEARRVRDAFAAGLDERRAGRMARVLAGEASPLRLARVRVQYDLDAEELAALAREARALEAEEARCAQDLAEARERARVALARQAKLAAAADALALEGRRAEESVAELEAEP